MNTVNLTMTMRQTYRVEADDSDCVHFPSVIISVISFLLLTEVKKTKTKLKLKKKQKNKK